MSLQSAASRKCHFSCPAFLLTWWVSPVSWHRPVQVPSGVGADQLLHFFNNKAPVPRGDISAPSPGPFSPSSSHQSSALAGAMSSIMMHPQNSSYACYRPQTTLPSPTFHTVNHRAFERNRGWREDTAEALYRMQKDKAWILAQLDSGRRVEAVGIMPKTFPSRRKSLFTSSCRAWASFPSCRPCPSSRASPPRTRARPCASWS